MRKSGGVWTYYLGRVGGGKHGPGRHGTETRGGGCICSAMLGHYITLCWVFASSSCKTQNFQNKYISAKTLIIYSSKIIDCNANKWHLVHRSLPSILQFSNSSVSGSLQYHCTEALPLTLQQSLWLMFTHFFHISCLIPAMTHLHTNNKIKVL